MSFNFTSTIQNGSIKLSIGGGNFFNVIAGLVNGQTSDAMNSLVDDSYFSTDSPNGCVFDLTGLPSETVAGEGDTIDADGTLFIRTTTEQLNAFLGNSSKGITFVNNFTGLMVGAYKSLVTMWKQKLYCTNEGKWYIPNAVEKQDIVYDLHFKRIKHILLGTNSGGVFTGVLFDLVNPDVSSNSATYTLLASRNVKNSEGVITPGTFILNRSDLTRAFDLTLRSYDVDLPAVLSTTIDEATKRVKMSVGGTYVSR